MSNKTLRVSSDTQIHMSTTYARNGGKQKHNRVFNFVIKGMLISTSLVGAVLTTGLASAPTAMAATSSVHASASMNRKTIEMNGHTVETPYGLVATDPSSGKATTFMPIWYVMQTLKNSLGIQNTWNGNDWHLTLPSNLKPAQALKAVSASSHSGYKNIYVNGTLVESVPSVASSDPDSGKATTYVPIWYVMQILKDVGVQSDWNGTTWLMTDGSGNIVSTPSQTVSTQDQKALILNLKNANNVLAAAIKHGQMTASIYNTLTKRLNSVIDKLSTGDQFTMVSELQTALSNTAPLLENQPSGDASLTQAYDQAALAYSTAKEQVDSLTTQSGDHFNSIQLSVNGKAVLQKASTMTHNNETYVSLYDAEQLVKNITGDQVGNLKLDSSGRYNKAQQWDGSRKVWDVAWSHAVANDLSGTQGNATFELNGSAVLKTDIITANVGKTPTAFVPVWAVQQVVDQMVGTGANTDSFTGGQWKITYNANQSYSTSGVSTLQKTTGSSTSDPSATGTMNWNN